MNIFSGNMSFRRIHPNFTQKEVFCLKQFNYYRIM